MTKAFDLHLGQLVVGLGWLTEEQLQTSLALSAESGEPVGRVLISHGHLSEREVRVLLQAQQMLRDRQITLAQAKNILTYSTWLGLSLEDTLIFCNIPVEPKQTDFRLGRLLSASGCLGDGEVEHFAQASQRAGIQLGRLLVLRQQLSKSMLEICLETQKLVRAGLLGYDQAIAGLTAIQLALEDCPVSSEDKIVPLGRLLIHSGLVTEKQINDALEVSRINGKPLGQVLVIFALISEATLQAALELQSLMRTNRLRAHCAVKALVLVFTQNISVLTALASVHDTPNGGSASDISLALFLRQTGLFTSLGDKLDALEHCASQTQQLRDLHVLVDEERLRMAVRCTFLIRRSIITFEQGILAFHHSILNCCEVDDFLLEVGWLNQEVLSALANGRRDRHLNVVAA